MGERSPRGEQFELRAGGYQALSAVNRHGRKGHEARVRAAAGLVNLMLDRKAA